jgi:hypothetical protein
MRFTWLPVTLAILITAGLLCFVMLLPAHVIHGDIEANYVIAAHHFYHCGVPRTNIALASTYHPGYSIVLATAFLLEKWGMRVVFHAGLIMNWLLWLASVWMIAREVAAWRTPGSACLLVLVALLPLSWSYVTVLYSETFFVMWLVGVWVLQSRLSENSSKTSLFGMGLWCGLTYAIRPAGIVVCVGMLVLSACVVQSTGRRVALVLGLCTGLSVAIALVSFARGSGMHCSTYAWPDAIGHCNPVKYAGRAALTFIRTIQIGFVDSLGMLLVVPLCLTPPTRNRDCLRAWFWLMCWLAASVGASCTVACYPIYQPGFVVGRYAAPFLLLTICSCMPLLADVRAGWRYACVCLVIYIVMLALFPVQHMRLIDNLSLAWMALDSHGWCKYLALLPAILLGMCIMRGGRWNWMGLIASVALVGMLNASSLWQRARTNEVRLRTLVGMLPATMCPGLTVTLGPWQRQMQYFDYTLLQLWYPAVRFRLPMSWSRQGTRHFDLSACTLMRPARLKKHGPIE